MCPQHERIQDVITSTSATTRSADEALVRDLLRDEAVARSCDDYVQYQRSVNNNSNNANSPHVSAWREKVTQWCYQVVDHIGEDREAVHFTMNILDRYIAGVDDDDDDVDSCSSKKYRTATSDPEAYQAAAMTALLLAVKFRARVRFGAEDLLQMSRGNLTPQEITSTAKEMIQCLSWQHRLPALGTFVRAILNLLPREDVGDEAFSSILDDATYHVEVSVCDSYFAGTKPSEVAYAAIHCAFDSCSGEVLSSEARSRFFARVDSLTELHRNSKSVQVLYSKLQSSYSQSSSSKSSNGDDDRSNNPPTRSTAPVVIPCDEEELVDAESSRPLSHATTCSPVVSVGDRSAAAIVVVADMTHQDDIYNVMRRVPAYKSLLPPSGNKRMRLCSQVHA